MTVTHMSTSSMWGKTRRLGSGVEALHTHCKEERNKFGEEMQVRYLKSMPVEYMRA